MNISFWWGKTKYLQDLLEYHPWELALSPPTAAAENWVRQRRGSYSWGQENNEKVNFYIDKMQQKTTIVPNYLELWKHNCSSNCYLISHSSSWGFILTFFEECCQQWKMQSLKVLLFTKRWWLQSVSRNKWAVKTENYFEANTNLNNSSKICPKILSRKTKEKNKLLPIAWFCLLTAWCL